MIGVVNESLLKRIFENEDIMTNFPELRALKKDSDYIVVKNCGGCEKKRKSRVKFRRLCAILYNMQSDRLNKLKRMLQVDTLQHTGFNPKTNTVGVFFL